MVYNNNNSDNMTLQGEDDKAEDEVNLETDPVLFLERIGKEQKFDVTFVEIEEVSKSVSYFFDFHLRAYRDIYTHIRFALRSFQFLSVSYFIQLIIKYWFKILSPFLLFNLDGIQCAFFSMFSYY